MPRHRISSHALTGMALATALVLTACGGGSDDDSHDHDHAGIDTAGRLAIAENASPTLHLHDLDSGRIAHRLTLAHAPSAVYASPGRRYALAFQRPQDSVQVIDGGIWQEDHGDHDHDYRAEPQLLTLRLAGPQPTHYDDRAGQAAIFMDGRASTAQNASARLINDDSLTAGNVMASLALPAPMHGFAEPNGTHLVVSALAEGASAPTLTEVYRRTGGAYSLVQRLQTPCPGMHGSYTQGSTTVAGCTDGALLVAPDGATGWRATRVLTPSRVSTIAGHPALPRFVGIGNSGVPSTTRFYDIDPATQSAAPIAIEGWAEGRVQRAHGFDRQGRHLFVLDDLGTLYVLRAGTSGWTLQATIAAAVPAMPAEAPFPALAANGARDEVYLSDPLGQQLLVLNSAEPQVKQRVALGFTPTYLAWLGITR